MCDVKLKPNKCGIYKSRFFRTDTRAPQENCASATEFTFYLAKSPDTTITNKAPSLEKHNRALINYPIFPQNC